MKQQVKPPKLEGLPGVTEDSLLGLSMDNTITLSPKKSSRRMEKMKDNAIG